MVVSFECPECGSEVKPGGLAPGRKVRCAECRTLVLVPFLLRHKSKGQWKRGWMATLRRSAWAWSGIGLAVTFLLVAVIVGAARSRGRVEREQEIQALARSAAEEERAGHFDRAFLKIEEALRRAKGNEAARSLDLATMRRDRDRISLKDAEARLGATSDMPPEQALGECRTLRLRAGSDTALAGLRPAIDERLLSKVQELLAAGARHLDAGRAAEAMAAAERAERSASNVPVDQSSAVHDEAAALAGRVIERFGLTFAPVSGEFLREMKTGPESHAQAQWPVLAEQLRARGYLPRPSRTGFPSLWDRLARYRLGLEVEESYDTGYLGSPNHTSRIMVTLKLTDRAGTTWTTRINAKTRIPAKTVSPFEGARLATGKKRDPEIERRLYSDALAALLELYPAKLRNAPEPGRARTPSSQSPGNAAPE